MDRQSGNSEISQSLEITNRHHAGAGTRQAINARITKDSEVTNASRAGARTRETKNRRITKDSGKLGVSVQTLANALDLRSNCFLQVSADLY